MRGGGRFRTPWFQPQESFNPVIHRLKDVIFHQATTADLLANPMPPPHPALVKYLQGPEGIEEAVKGRGKELKEVFGIKVVPPVTKREGKKGEVEGEAE